MREGKTQEPKGHSPTHSFVPQACIEHLLHTWHYWYMELSRVQGKVLVLTLMKL